jgi:hypothetical protein
MSLGSTLKVLNKAVKVGLQAASEKAKPCGYVAAGRRLACFHCGGDVFSENLAGMGLVVNNISGGRFLVCVNCSHVMIFGDKVRKLTPRKEDSAETPDGKDESQVNHE